MFATYITVGLSIASFAVALMVFIMAATSKYAAFNISGTRPERTKGYEMEPTFIKPQMFKNVQKFTCTACSDFAIVEQLGIGKDTPRFCPSCGAKVVSAND